MEWGKITVKYIFVKNEVDELELVGTKIKVFEFYESAVQSYIWIESFWAINDHPRYYLLNELLTFWLLKEKCAMEEPLADYI